MTPAELLEQDFGTLPALIKAQAGVRSDHPALVQDGAALTYGALDRWMDRIAAALQRDGAKPGGAVAIVSAARLSYAAAFLGALRAGVAVAPLPPSATPAQIAGMIADADATHLFVDADAEATLAPELARLEVRPVRIDSGDFDTWMMPDGATPAPVAVTPDMPFNIIYSSGTTGTPKGIVQPLSMRWVHIRRNLLFGYAPDTVTLIATPLYSNTTLVAFFPTLGAGGTVVLMARFDAAGYLALAERHRATHTMLVPVQYRRIMALPDFGRFDLSSFKVKLCTSAPFDPALKADVVKRWPGGLFEVYGMTEGGGATLLAAHLHPNKLHTVGVPLPGHEIRVLDEQGRDAPPGQIGEIVGHSGGTMRGYHKQPAKTAETEWFDDQGRRFIRTGDLGRFDADGFLELMDRRKDMIISGGFNVYPSDLEAELRQHPGVADVAVVGVPSAEWGETPVAFVVARDAAVTAADLLAFANARLGKMQRLKAVELIAELPRSAIGKVLKRELRDAYAAKK